jgi:hypothetical protein
MKSAAKLRAEIKKQEAEKAAREAAAQERFERERPALERQYVESILDDIEKEIERVRGKRHLHYYRQLSHDTGRRVVRKLKAAGYKVAASFNLEHGITNLADGNYETDYSSSCNNPSVTFEISW